MMTGTPDKPPRKRDDSWWHRDRLTISAASDRDFQAQMHARLREARTVQEIEALRADNEAIDTLGKATKEAVLGMLADREDELRREEAA